MQSLLFLCLCLVGTALAAHGHPSDGVKKIHTPMARASLSTRGQRQLTSSQSAKDCKLPHVPRNGGLTCVTVNSTRYCKPMCNKDHDFEFLRRSRLFEKCGQSTGYHWTTQYIGGLRLADCARSAVRVSGQPSAYFAEQCVRDNKKVYEEFWKEVNKAVLRPVSLHQECKKPHCTDPLVRC
ncbi:uncharacterized protein LOC144946539 isoform X1 [Lampetra fluviatilis]